MKNIVLTGFMASGKTTVANAICEISGMKMVDTDEMVEEKEGITINEIFDRYGEQYFRDRESEAILEASQLCGVVIATGGGAVLREQNIDALRKNGIIFNLEPSVLTICNRLNAARSTRPLLQGEELDAVIARFHKRQPYYNNCDCKIYVKDEKSPQDTAIEILNRMRDLT